MKNLLITGAALLGAFVAAAPASAQITYFDFTGGNSLTTGSVNSRQWTVNNITVTATAWSTPYAWTSTTPTALPTAGYLGWYSAGLGVTNTSEDGSYPQHTIDNVGGQYDFVSLAFSAPVQLLYGALTPFNVNSGSTPADNDASVSFTMNKGPVNQTASWNELSLHTTEVSGNLSSAQGYATYLNPGMNTGYVWTIGADRINKLDKIGDGFKLSGITVQIPTPEPGTWALMMAGLGVVGLSLRRARARGANDAAGSEVRRLA